MISPGDNLKSSLFKGRLVVGAASLSAAAAYQDTKIPSAKESALFWTRDVVRVSYEIASSPHEITLERNRALFLLVNIFGRGGLDNCAGIKTIFWHNRDPSVCI